MERGTGLVDRMPRCGFFWLTEARPDYCAESGVWGRPPATAAGPAAPLLFAEAAEEVDGRKGRSESINARVLLKAGTPLYFQSLREFKDFPCLSPEINFLKEVLPCGSYESPKQLLVSHLIIPQIALQQHWCLGYNYISQQLCGERTGQSELFLPLPRFN